MWDSRLVIEQANGHYEVRASRIIPLYNKTASLLEPFNWTTRWIPREENTVADELSLKAIQGVLLEELWSSPSDHAADWSY